MLFFKNISETISRSSNTIKFSFLLLLLSMFYLNSSNLNESPSFKRELLDTTEKLNTLTEKIHKIESYLSEIGKKSKILAKPFLNKNSKKKTSKETTDHFLMKGSETIEEKMDLLYKEAQRQSYYLDDLIKLSEEKEEKQSRLPFLSPLGKKPIKISSRFGFRIHPILKKKRMHNGIDFSAKEGTPIYAPAKGVIFKSGYDKNFGNRIIINHLNGYMTLYAHLAHPKKGSKLPKKGTHVEKGILIGRVGNTGKLSTGPHLHYEIFKNHKRINPMECIRNGENIPTITLTKEELEDIKDLAYYNYNEENFD